VTSSDGGINCGNSCSKVYNIGTSVTLNAIPAAGSVFAGWTGCCSSTSSSLTIDLSSHAAITATFVPQPGPVITSGELLLSWTDNSSTEDGFKIERKTGTSGSYTQIAAAGANVTSYNDSSLISGTVYCYRVAAFNAGGASPYTSEGCSPARSAVQTFALSVATTGAGGGTVTSTPAGITCPGDCSEAYSKGTVVNLTAKPATGFILSGWSGTGCANGTVTMNGDVTCTATFAPQPVATHTITVAKSGDGNGTVISSDTSLNCGTVCSTAYPAGSSLTLTATPAAGSVFTGWSGCCFGNSTSLTVNVAASATVIATFSAATPTTIPPHVENTTRIGLFRPSSGEWFLDYDGDGHWNERSDIYVGSLGKLGDLPVVGSWSSDGNSGIGLFNPDAGSWKLDIDRDWILNCVAGSSDSCFGPFGAPGDIPVTRKVNGSTSSIIGTYSPQTTIRINGRNRTRRGIWRFNLNTNKTFDGCSVDECDIFGDFERLPIVGDWNDTGIEQIGVFVPSSGNWLLDKDGDGTWDGCLRDKCLGPFGSKRDLPIIGDWDGSGKTRIGVFRPSTGMWYLDMNGNGILDECSVDRCIGPFGVQGDLPVVGKW
jgi:hypothetical protein